MNTYYITIALVLGCAVTVLSQSEPTNRPVEGIPEDKVRDARQAMQGATNQLQNNLIGVFTQMANSSHIAGLNVSRSAAMMIRGLVSNTFQLTGVVAYMPRLIFLDGPTHATCSNASAS